MVEGRGSSKGHVGLAIMDLRQADIEINEFIDSSTFSRLKTKLMIAEPLEVRKSFCVSVRSFFG